MPCSLEAQSQYKLGFLDKGAPYLDSLKPLGLRGCVVFVMWCDVGVGAREGMHFSQSKNARLLNLVKNKNPN